MIPSTASGFVFENYGGSYQLRVSSADDLAALDGLDEPFWMAISAPVSQLACDNALMKWLDEGGSGRVQSGDIRRAVQWLLSVFCDYRGVNGRSDTVVLEALDVEANEGKRLHEAARRILHNLGCPDETKLTLAQVRDRQTIFAQGIHNGDGVVPPPAVPEEDLRVFAEDVMATMGSVDDLSGAQGINGELLGAFLENARGLIAWQDQCRAEEEAAEVFPFGQETAACHALYERLRGPLDRYFQQCRLIALNEILERPCPDLDCPPETFNNLAAATAYGEEAPLARPWTDGILDLDGRVNPFYEEALAEFRGSIVQTASGRRLPQW